MVKARLTGVTNKELEETYGRLEETGGCSRRMLGLLAGGGSADVAGWVDGFNGKVVGDLLFPRVRGGLGQYKPLVGRATGIRQQFLWVTTAEGPRVRQQQAQVRIRVSTHTRIHSTGASACPSTNTLDLGGAGERGLRQRTRRPPWVKNFDSSLCIW